MSQLSGGSPPSLTTIDALLSLKEFINSPEAVARVQELREAEAAARTAQADATAEKARAKALLDEHAEKVREHEANVATFEADKAQLARQRDLFNRKVAKMREADDLR